MNFKRISVAEARDLLAANPAAQIIDIRDEESFARGHIDCATNINNNNVQEFLNAADTKQPLLVCCYHGNTSQSAAAYFADQGFEQSYSLDGGFEAWEEGEATA
jgi:thiosulfate sulfurtransferase